MSWISKEGLRGESVIMRPSLGEHFFEQSGHLQRERSTVSKWEEVEKFM